MQVTTTKYIQSISTLKSTEMMMTVVKKEERFLFIKRLNNDDDAHFISF